MSPRIPQRPPQPLPLPQPQPPTPTPTQNHKHLKKTEKNAKVLCTVVGAVLNR